MHPLAPPVSAWFASHHGVGRHADLLSLGVTRNQIRRLLTLEILVREGHQVYRLTAAPSTDLQRAAAVCGIADHVMVSHHSAGRLWGLRRLGRDRRLHVTIQGRSNRRLSDVALHRSHRIDGVDVVVRDDGIRLTSPPRTVFDLCAVLGDDAITSIVEQLLHERHCTVPTLFDTGRRLRERGRPGSARFARVLQSRPAFAKPLGSDLEHRLEQAVLAAGLPRPVRQHPVRLEDGTVVHPDFCWPHLGEAVEVDHITWHGGKLDATYDNQRDRKLRRVGIRVTRVTDDEVRFELHRVIADLRALLAPSRAH